MLICRSYFHVNYEHVVSGVGGSCVELNEGVVVPVHLAQKHFTHSYCRTCHSFQGSSIDKAISVVDWNFVPVNRKWLHAAVTRARDLKNVQFFDYDEDKENEEQMLQYFQ